MGIYGAQCCLQFKASWGVSELSLQMRCHAAGCDCCEAHRSGWKGDYGKHCEREVLVFVSRLKLMAQRQARDSGLVLKGVLLT